MDWARVGIDAVQAEDRPVDVLSGEMNIDSGHRGGSRPAEELLHLKVGEVLGTKRGATVPKVVRVHGLADAGAARCLD